MERVEIEHENQHLCDSCKFVAKCPRLLHVLTTLSKLEVEVLEKWRLDITTAYMIEECDLFSLNWDMVESIEFEDDGEEDEEGDNFGRRF